MGTGWRKAFCTTIPRSRENAMVMEEEEEDAAAAAAEKTTEVQPKCSRSYLGRSKSGLSSGNRPPSTPRLQTSNSSPNLFCKTNANIVQTSLNDDNVNIGQKLRCKTAANTPKSCSRSPRTILLGSNSNPSSPRSPFSMLKNSFRLSKNNSCGVCMQSVKAGQGMAIYTAECSHTFHFPCIVDFLKKQTTLICPICKSPWKDVPLLTIHKLQPSHQNQQQEEQKVDTKKTSPKKSMNEKQRQENEIPPHSPKIKYHDDEPLISPKFHPIPEEEDDDDSEEFKGFFVNPTPDIDNAFKDSHTEFKNVEISLLPESAVIAVGRTHETVAVMLKIKAPPPSPLSGAAQNTAARRAPIDLVSVLDVSGGMNGAKLQMLKRAMRLVISSLGSADRLSIVAYAANPKRLMPLRRMNGSGQRSARRIIDQLECGSGTCANEALRKAAKILEHRRERNPVASIILLSGGQEDNVQVKNDNQQRKSAGQSSTTRFSHIEIPVHSSGFGEKPGYTSHVPEEDAFSKCVGGLLSVVVQDLRVQFSSVSGSNLAEILAVYSCNGRPAFLGSDLIRVGDLYAEEEKEFLVEMRVPASTTGSRHVVSIRSSYKHAVTQELVYNREHVISVPKPQTLQGNERMRNLFISTRAIAESRRLIEQNELNKAMQLLSSARAFVMQSKFDSSKEHVNSLEAELAGVQWKMQYKQRQTLDQVKIVRRKISDQGASLFLDEDGESLTPTSAWKAAEKLAKMAMMKKSFSRVGDLHGLENARF